MILNVNTKEGKLTHVEDRIIVSVDMNFKNFHTFSNGHEITLARNFDNFDRRYTEPVNATVISAKDIPKGAYILIHHNSCHEVHRIHNHEQLSGKIIAEDVRIFSIPTTEAFAWKMADGEWQPTKGFAFALRIFKPYNGPIHGIKPEKIKNILWCTTGEYSGKAMHTLIACDYEIIFREISTGQESRLIRCRPDGDEKTHKDPEFVCINHGITDKILNGEYLIGLSPEDAKTVSQIKTDEIIAKKKPKGKLLNLDSHA